MSHSLFAILPSSVLSFIDIPKPNLEYLHKNPYIIHILFLLLYLTSIVTVIKKMCQLFILANKYIFLLITADEKQL